MSDGEQAGVPLEEVFRAEWRRIVSVLVRLCGDLDRAEECAQEALVAALERWPVSGAPINPGAWLMTTARNRALDRLRADARGRARRGRLAAEEALRREESNDALPDEDEIESDQLRLIFTCCHPALTREARIALTLRLLGGLTTPEIAATFLISETTAAQRIVRAKKAIRDRRLPYRIPESAELAERLPAVLDVLYLIFNAGYEAHEGELLIRTALCDEALALGRLVLARFPDDRETAGLLALMEIQASRERARTGPDGSLVLLEDQDRTRWDRVRIERARRLIARPSIADASDERGAFVLQAEIALCHATADRFENTDWGRIAELYEELAILTRSPVVELNQTVAIGMRDGPEAALVRLDRLASDGRLASYPMLEATRADFLRRLGRFEDAIECYRKAAERTRNQPERRYLEERIAECREALA